MELKHSVMIPLMGRQVDRFHEYQPARPLAERLEMARRVRGINGIEVVYPGDFYHPRGSATSQATIDIGRTLSAIGDSGLPVSAVNLNVKSAKKWQSGSFTATDPQLRADAVADLKTAMDLAAELGAGMITCCPLIDGHNYAFQADYLKQWQWLEEGIAEGARYRSDIKVSLEYKLNESRNFCVLPDMGRTLYLCERLGLPNVGVTMDVGHALMAKETPAEVMCLAGQAGRLFYVHLNDNGREWDWDMLPGSVNLWDLVEMLFYLDRMDWSGWLAYDVSTRNGDPVEMMSATISIVNTAWKLLDKLGRDRLQSLVEEGLPARAFDYLVKSLL